MYSRVYLFVLCWTPASISIKIFIHFIMDTFILTGNTQARAARCFRYPINKTNARPNEFCILIRIASSARSYPPLIITPPPLPVIPFFLNFNLETKSISIAFHTLTSNNQCSIPFPMDILFKLSNTWELFLFHLSWKCLNFSNRKIYRDK